MMSGREGSQYLRDQKSGFYAGAKRLGGKWLEEIKPVRSLANRKKFVARSHGWLGFCLFHSHDKCEADFHSNFYEKCTHAFGSHYDRELPELDAKAFEICFNMVYYY